MIEYDEFISSYGRLERRIQRCMASQSGGLCTRCVMPCCRIDFCRESLESPFLEAVRTLFAPGIRWDPAVGWLTNQGCCLPAGRPPVCYEFLCRSLQVHQPSALHRDALQVLAGLITDTGRRARGRRHLVELNDLGRLNLKRLTDQLKRAQSTLAQLERFWACAKDYLSSEAGGGGAPRVPSR